MPIRGLRATTIGSWAGFRAVPQPCQICASLVCASLVCGDQPSAPKPFLAIATEASLRDCGSSLGRSAPAALSIALLTSSDLGNPEPYKYIIWSRISNPASSTALARRWYVLEPPKASKCPPGFRTLSAWLHSSTLYAIPELSQDLPMKPSSYGGSVTIESTLLSGISASNSRQFPFISITGIIPETVSVH